MRVQFLSIVLLAQWTTASVLKRAGNFDYGTPCALVSSFAAAGKMSLPIKF